MLNAEQRLSVGLVFSANMAGYLGNSFLPARAGELVRTFAISARSSLSKTYVLTTALCERLMDVIALVLWSSLILLGTGPKPRWMEDLSRTTAMVAAAGALAIALLPHTESLCRNLLRRLPLPSALRERLLRFADQVLLGVRAFHNVGRFLGFTVLTVAIWMTDAFGVDFGGVRPAPPLFLHRGHAAAHRHGPGERAALHARLCGDLPVCRGDGSDAVWNQPGCSPGVHPGGAGIGLRGDARAGPAQPVLDQGSAYSFTTVHFFKKSGSNSSPIPGPVGTGITPFLISKLGEYQDSFRAGARHTYSM